MQPNAIELTQCPLSGNYDRALNQNPNTSVCMCPHMRLRCIFDYQTNQNYIPATCALLHFHSVDYVTI